MSERPVDMSSVPGKGGNLGNYAAFLPEVAARFGGKPAVVGADGTLTYADLEHETNRLAAGLVAAGVRPGDRVGLMLGNAARFPLAFFAILKMGAAAVPLDVTFKARETSHLLDQLEAAALIVEAASAREGAGAAAHCRWPCRLLSLGLAGTPEATWAAPLEDLAPVAPQPAAIHPVPVNDADTALICYTSGSTGRPKGAEITHGNLWAANRSWQEEVLVLTPDDVAVTPLPLAHSYGLNGSLNTPLMVGATVVVIPRFDPVAVVEAIRAHKGTVLFGVATMYRRLVAAAGDLGPYPSLQIAVSGAADMPLALAKDVQRRFGAPVVRGYGASEIFRVITFRRGDADERPERIGRLACGAEIRFVDEGGRPLPPGEVGEMEVSGPTVMKGYYGDPEETAAAFRDGWFRTGDLARMDAEGYVSIAGRKKDTILRGGYSIFPREVEDVILSHPAVAEAIVVGVTDQGLGQEVKAVVVPRGGATLTAEDVIAFCKARLAHFKYPRIVEFATSLPRGTTGKVRRHVL